MESERKSPLIENVKSCVQLTAFCRGENKNLIIRENFSREQKRKYDFHQASKQAAVPRNTSKSDYTYFV